MEKITFYLLACALGIVTSVSASLIMNRNSKIENAASVEYVDGKDNELKAIDISILAKVEQKADKSDIEEMKEQINFMYQQAYKKANKNNE